MQNLIIGLTVLLVAGAIIAIFPPAFLAGIAVFVIFWMFKVNQAENRKFQKEAEEMRRRERE